MEWRTIPQYPRYEASDTGKIRHRKNKKVLKGNWRGPTRCQYIRVKVNGRAPDTEQPVHRLVLMAFIGPPTPERPIGLHRNGDRTDNSAANLYWGTYRENARDALRHRGEKWHAKGEASGNAKLSNQQAKEILSRYRTANGKRCTQSRLAKEYGLHVSTVNQLVRGVTWSWLHGDNKRSGP